MTRFHLPGTYRGWWLCLLLLLFGNAHTLVAQAPPPGAGRLFVLNEGPAGAKGTLGFVGYPGGYFQLVDSIPVLGNFGKPTDLLRVDTTLYVGAGDGSLLAYSTNSLRRIATVPNVSVRQLAAAPGNRLVITTNAKPYVRVFNRLNLAAGPLFTLDSSRVRDIAEGVLVLGDTAWVAVNGFGAPNVGELVSFRLSTADTVRTLRTRNNPNSLLYAAPYLYAQCLDFTNGLVIQQIDPAALAITRTDSCKILSYGGFVLRDSLIVFNNSGSFPAQLASYRLSDGFIRPSYLTFDSYGLVSEAEGLLFGSTTNFFSTGSISYFRGTTAGPYSVSVGVSPRDMEWQNDSLPYLNLGADRFACGGFNDSLVAGYPGPGEVTYQWQDGNALPARRLTSTVNTTYWVQATNRYGKTRRDSVVVSVEQPPVVNRDYPQSGIVNQALSFALLGALDSCQFSYRAQDSSTVTRITSGGCATLLTFARPDTYFVFVRAWRNGCSTLDSVSFVVNAATAKPGLQNVTLSLYPNPAHEAVTLAGLPAESQPELYLVNATGQIWQLPGTTAVPPLNLNISHLPRGVYWLQVQWNDQQQTLRLVKQ